MYWYQLCKANFLLQGDSNTKLLANLKEYITSYYKSLFGPPENNHVSMVEGWTNDIPQVSSLENDILTAEFSEKEVKDAIFQMEHNSAPGPDGFPAEFY